MSVATLITGNRHDVKGNSIAMFASAIHATNRLGLGLRELTFLAFFFRQQWAAGMLCC
jgi:hypothetical protein